MALGNTYNNNKKEVYSPMVYGYSMSNTESKVDKTNLGYSYWNNFIILKICPMIQQGDSDQYTPDFKKGGAIYLSHTKARILAEEAKLFLSDMKKYSGSGVASGQNSIMFSDGSEFGSNIPCIVIRKVTAEGVVESSFAYQFKRDYHCAIRNYEEKTGEFEKEMDAYQNIEILQLITELETYYMAATNATAFSVMEAAKFQKHREDTRIEKIAEKLGVSFDSQKQKSSNSYWNNKGGSSTTASSSEYSQQSLDDIID